MAEEIKEPKGTEAEEKTIAPDEKPIVPAEKPVVDKKKSSPLTIGLAIVLSALVFGYLGYWYGTNKTEIKDTSATATVTATATTSAVASATTTADPTASWKTYTDTEDGYSFKYPQQWTITKDEKGTIGDAEWRKVIIKDINGNEFDFWKNGEFGAEGSTYAYTAALDNNGKIVISEKKPLEGQQDPSVGGYTLMNLKEGNNNISFAYLVNPSRDKTAQGTFDQILSTFKFTK